MAKSFDLSIAAERFRSLAECLNNPLDAAIVSQYAREIERAASMIERKRHLTLVEQPPRRRGSF